MNKSNDAPIYNLKAIVQETRLKPDTLRAWERRYGLPKPKRTASGHRLYSQNDIDMLHWLIARQEEGLSISRAVEMWTHLQGEESLLSGEPGASSLVQSVSGLSAIRPSSINGDATISDFTEQWISACLNFDQALADQILSQAFALFPTETVCLKLIQSGLAKIGEGWYRGIITVQQEHFASSMALRRLETMLTLTPPPTRKGRILIGNPPDEEHTFVPLMLTLLLRRHGWDVVYLGANVPIADLDQALESICPDLVLLTAQQLHTAATLFEMSQILVQERIPLAFGGMIFNQLPDLFKLIPGYFLGERIEDAIQSVEQLMAAPRVKLAQRIVSHEYRYARIHFQEQQAHIEANVWEQANTLGIHRRELSIANDMIGRSILAALELGDIHYVDSSLNWVEGTMVNHHQVAAAIFRNYMRIYGISLYNILDMRAPMIRDWFSAMLGIEKESTGKMEMR